MKALSLKHLKLISLFVLTSNVCYISLMVLNIVCYVYLAKLNKCFFFWQSAKKIFVFNTHILRAVLFENGWGDHFICVLLFMPIVLNLGISLNLAARQDKKQYICIGHYTKIISFSNKLYLVYLFI